MQSWKEKDFFFKFKILIRPWVTLKFIAFLVCWLIIWTFMIRDDTNLKMSFRNYDCVGDFQSMVTRFRCIANFELNINKLIKHWLNQIFRKILNYQFYGKFLCIFSSRKFSDSALRNNKMIVCTSGSERISNSTSILESNSRV